MNRLQRQALTDLYDAYRREGYDDAEAAVFVADDLLEIVKLAPAPYCRDINTGDVRVALDAARAAFEATPSPITKSMIAVLDVACPRCGAGPGFKCVTMGGVKQGVPHTARVAKRNEVAYS